MEDGKKNKSHLFQKGVSGNPGGRPKHAKGKAMTDKQVMDYLGKRTEKYLYMIDELATTSKNEQLRFRCLNGLLSYDFQMRASEYKKRLEAAKLKQAKDLAGLGGGNPLPEETEEDLTTEFQLHAIDKG